ncbi:MAG: ABC transporter permease [Bacteroidetes bacterium]|nr:ABC transporter permease [Bacteroidota bacterium]
MAATALQPAGLTGRRPSYLRNPLVIALQRSVAQPMGLACLLIFSLLVLSAIAAPLITPYNPAVQTAGEELVGPSWVHPFGTDELGRDLLSRTLYGIRISLIAGVPSVLVGAVIGTLAGLAAAYWLGPLDAVLMRIVDGLFAFPPILMGIAILAALGPGLVNVTIVITVLQIPMFARLARAAALQEKKADYVTAARALGASSSRILFQHILLNGFSPLMVQAAAAMGFAVGIEASLSFLGLGINPPEPSLGAILMASQRQMRHALWYPVFPGMAITLLILSLNGIADAVNNAFARGYLFSRPKG